MFEVRLEGVDRLDSLGRKLHVATVKKMTELTDILYNKVIENVSGKILQKQSGELAASIRKQVDTGGFADLMIGQVFVEPETPKAKVLEFGGEKSYVIVPIKAQALHFFSKSGEEVFTKYVYHPPSKEFRYLREALEEMEYIIPEGFRQAIETAIINE